MYTIWHNTRCSKSRQALALLQKSGVGIVERYYLENPPSREELESALVMLDCRPIDITRVGEPLFKELGLSKGDDDAVMLDALANNPKLIERPIVIKDGKEAVVGRPPENVLGLIGEA